MISPNTAEVKRLFDFLEFRTFDERLAEALGPAGASCCRREERVRAGRRDHRQRVAGRRRPRRCRRARAGRARRRRATASRARRRCRASPSSPTPRRPRCSGSRPPTSPTRRSPRRSARRRFLGHDTKPLMRSLLRERRSTSAARARHRHRRLPARPGRGPLRARPRPRGLHARSPRRATTHGGRASSTSTARPAEPPTDRRRARRSPSRARRADPGQPRSDRAWPSCTARSRTRSSSCWPGWSTSASPSTVGELRDALEADSPPRCSGSASS